MKTSLFFLPSLLSLLAVYPAYAANADFHKAQSAAEKRLDEILWNDTLLMERNQPPNMHNFLVHKQGYNPSLDTGYAQMFTKALINSAAKKKPSICQNDISCTFDYNVISCMDAGADRQNYYLYRTEKVTDKEAIISYGWPAHDEVMGTYRLVKEQGHWKLDGISCLEDQFNM